MCRLLSCCINEKESNGELLTVWTFPRWNEDSLLQSMTFLKENRHLGQDHKGFFYFKLREQWTYSLEKNDFIILLSAADYNAAKYRALLGSLTDAYLTTCDPTSVLEIYLNADQLKLEEENRCGTRSLKELVKLFGLEVIQIYNALLLKRRLVVYHYSPSALLEWMAVLPNLIRHRDLSDDIWPWIDLISLEAKRLQTRESFLVGCSDNAIFNRTNEFDLLVNLPANELILPRHAKDKLQVTKIHKKIAQELEKLANDESITEKALIEALNDRTQALLDQIKVLAGENGILEENIKNRLPSPVSEFFIQLANSESIRIRN